jgi:N-acetylmuramoyl-L-alanine amidase
VSLPFRVLASPNVEPRREGQAIDMLILHYTGMASADKACAWLCSTESKVSCHYLVDEAGGVVNIADEELRAWHAGVSSWKGETDINSRSIGIEIHNPGHAAGYPDFPPAQMAAVARLARAICQRHAIPPERVLAHSDVAPARKIDPGEKFDWAYLRAHGVGHWVEPSLMLPGAALQPGAMGGAVSELQSMLACYGYGIAVTGTYDGLTEAVVKAFQRHFRQSRVDGAADAATVETLRLLLDSLTRD